MRHDQMGLADPLSSQISMFAYLSPSRPCSSSNILLGHVPQQSSPPATVALHPSVSVASNVEGNEGAQSNPESHPFGLCSPLVALAACRRGMLGCVRVRLRATQDGPPPGRLAGAPAMSARPSWANGDTEPRDSSPRVHSSTFVVIIREGMSGVTTTVVFKSPGGCGEDWRCISCAVHETGCGKKTTTLLHLFCVLVSTLVEPLSTPPLPTPPSVLGCLYLFSPFPRASLSVQDYISTLVSMLLSSAPYFTNVRLRVEREVADSD